MREPWHRWRCQALLRREEIAARPGAVVLLLTAGLILSRLRQ